MQMDAFGKPGTVHCTWWDLAGAHRRKHHLPSCGKPEFSLSGTVQEPFGFSSH